MKFLRDLLHNSTGTFRVWQKALSNDFSTELTENSIILVRLSMIVRVNVLPLLTVTDVSTTCAVVIFRVKVSCIKSVDGIKHWLST